MCACGIVLVQQAVHRPLRLHRLGQSMNSGSAITLLKGVKLSYERGLQPLYDSSGNRGTQSRAAIAAIRQIAAHGSKTGMLQLHSNSGNSGKEM